VELNVWVIQNWKRSGKKWSWSNTWYTWYSPIICLDVLSKTTVNENSRNGEQPKVPTPTRQTELRNVTYWISTCSSILLTWCVLAVLTTEQLRMSSAVQLTLNPLYCPVPLWEIWATSLYCAYLIIRDLLCHSRTYSKTQRVPILRSREQPFLALRATLFATFSVI
jgi:hypothetical protein